MHDGPGNGPDLFRSRGTERTIGQEKVKKEEKNRTKILHPIPSPWFIRRKTTRIFAQDRRVVYALIGLDSREFCPHQGAATRSTSGDHD